MYNEYFAGHYDSATNIFKQVYYWMIAHTQQMSPLYGKFEIAYLLSRSSTVFEFYIVLLGCITSVLILTPIEYLFY